MGQWISKVFSISDMLVDSVSVSQSATVVPQSGSKGPSTLHLPVESGNKAPAPNSDQVQPLEGDVSIYTVNDPQPYKDDGTAPLRYPHRSSKDQPKKRKYSCCHRRKHRGKANEPNSTDMLASFSKAAIDRRSMPPDYYVESSASEEDDHYSGDDSEDPLEARFHNHGRGRRTKVANRPDVSMSLWALVKNAIGKDLTKLPLPVNFNEPLSMLQRLTEDFEYSALIDKATRTQDSLEQMAYIAAFTVSSYASSALRTGKPFNPLLGETFECDRTDDFGWKCFSEQVSHHPPLLAQHCEGHGWTCWQQFSMSSKFKGNSIEIVPFGIVHLVIADTKSGPGNHYTWHKVPSIVHNIMIGKLWIDQEGEMDIFNHMTGVTCNLKYTTSSLFRGEAKRVEGTIYNKEKQPKLFLAGNWNNKMESFEIVKVDSSNKFILGQAKLIWSRIMPAFDSDKYYNFTVLACQLNEMEDGVAPTDSRRRTDQRLMENGYFDDANDEKLRLEDKQRVARKARLAQMASISQTRSIQTNASDRTERDDEEWEPGYTPVWFVPQQDSVSGKMTHIFKGDYWECKARQDWSRCPNIY